MKPPKNKIQEMAQELKQFFNDRKHIDGDEFFEIAVEKIILSLQQQKIEQMLETLPKTLTLNS